MEEQVEVKLTEHDREVIRVIKYISIFSGIMLIGSLASYYSFIASIAIALPNTVYFLWKIKKLTKQ